jgi:transcriptional regulator with XRE-family HTH domain
MKIESKLTDEVLLGLLGERLATLRLAKGLSQEQLAEEAGLGVRTVQRLEKGAVATQLSGFLRVCRVLGLVERFEALVPEVAPSPMEQLRENGRMQSNKRQRVSVKKMTATKPKKWTWGEPE